VSGAISLMIVAHPDDESLWGGGEIIDEDYFVVCVTGGRNKKRSRELAGVMERTGSEFLIMKYRDTWGVNWGLPPKALQDDLATIIADRNWKKIVTHNQRGEYGHPHHKFISNLVTGICRTQGVQDRLCYFGDYYTRKRLAVVQGELPMLDVPTYKKKLEPLELYKSQRIMMNILRHMALYESIVPAIGK